MDINSRYKNEKSIFLCCEENYGCIGFQEGAISCIELKDNVEDAFFYMIDRLKAASIRNDVLSEDSEEYFYCLTDKKRVKLHFFNEIEKNGYAGAILFCDKEKSTEYEYAITVRKFNLH